MLIFILSFIHTCENEIITLLFVKQKCKHCEMAFLTSRNVSEHVLLALGVDHAAMDALKAGVLTSESRKLHPSQFTGICHVSSLHNSSITSFERRQANAVEFATKVCF